MSASLLSFFKFPFTRQSEKFGFEVFGKPRCQLPPEPREVHVKAGIRGGGDQRAFQKLQELFRFSSLKGL